MRELRHRRSNLSTVVRRGLAITAVAAVALHAPARGASAVDPFEAGRPYSKLYLDVDGLPQNTVHALIVDREGSLWVGTQDGAAAYDGRAWRRLDLPQADRSNFVRSMLESRDGSIWIGRQAGGLVRYRAGEWVEVDYGSTGLGDARVNALLETKAEDGSTVLWVGTADAGVLRYDGQNWTRFGPAAGLPSAQVWSLLESTGPSGKEIWIGTTAGPATLRLADSRIAIPAGAPSDSVSSLLETLAPDGARAVWVGTYGGGLLRWQGGSWRRYGAADGLPSLFVTDLAASPSAGPEAVWIGTDGGGVARFRDDRIETIELGALLASKAVYKILETRAEQGARAVWLGTRNNGLIRLTEGLWRAFQPFPETPNVPVTAILERLESDGSTSLWLGTDGYGVALFRNGVWSRIDRASGAIGNDTVLALAESRHVGGRSLVWVGTRNGGLASFDGGGWRHYRQATGELPSDLVQTVLETTDDEGRGRLWVGTRSGLASFDGRRWQRGGSEPGFPTGSILSLAAAQSPEGRRELWVGTAAGLYRLAGGRWASWVEGEGLRNRSIQSLHVSVARSGKRTLWIGTDGAGAALLDMDDPAAAPRGLAELGSPALSKGTVYGLLEDRQGRIYASTNRGVTRLVANAAGFRRDEFSTEHGLPLNQGNRGAAFRDEQGRLWFGTIGGAAAFDPAAEFRDQRPKRLRLSGRLADCEGCELFDRGAVAHDQNRIEFRYSLLSFFGEPLTRYRTQLGGLEETPSAWTPAHSREVAGLAPGAYVFRVWGRDAAGIVSGPEELSFVVRPAPWQTQWAQLLLICGAASVVALAARIRSRAHHRRERELEDLVEARTRQLTRANDLRADLSYVDPLTAVPNRRRFDDLFASEWKRCLRAASPLALVMIDIDSFKGFNDNYGHLEGDSCLKSVALSLADGLVRSGDAVARYGGEEFAVILPATDVAGALLVAEHLRRRVERLAIPNAASKANRVVTVSCGVAATTPNLEQDASELLRRADEALYRAKRAGGNSTQTG